MKYGIIRVACASPALVVGDCAFNATEIIKTIQAADAQDVRLLVLPELCITGYTCADLFLQRALRKAAAQALLRIAKETADSAVLSVIGLPCEFRNVLYNCAAFIHKGKVLAIVPKSYIPTYSEFYERRWFAPAEQDMQEDLELYPDAEAIPFGTNIILQDANDSTVMIAAEICEDLWVPSAPSLRHALHGATIIANLSASNELAGKAAYRNMLVTAHSAKILGAYLYASAGHDESSTDMVFGGHRLIAVNGTSVCEARPFSHTEQELIVADIDVERIAQDRLRTTTFADCVRHADSDGSSYRYIPVDLKDNCFATDSRAPIGFGMNGGSSVSEDCRYKGNISRHPFIPHTAQERSERCQDIITMQAEGLAKRLRHVHAAHAVIGLSGGLDSTLALLVTAQAFDICGLDRSGISAITMPCFGTTDRTYQNARQLAHSVGATLKEIRIEKAVRQHFADIGHDENIHDTTYENAQARGRTYILMDYANKQNGLVIGTGDLSELALGWCTYNGDHISMYGVNASIPKTLVRHLVAWFATQKAELSPVLNDILDTPVSPELLPPTGNAISQKTEELVGPYELHDFFLYYVLRWGFSPKKIFFLAEQAFLYADADGEHPPYTKQEIFRWLRRFYQRFFSQQFKRSCMPDGAKVGTVSLSPRGDWRMPSDADAAVWLAELTELAQEQGLQEA